MSWKPITGALRQITCKGANVVGCTPVPARRVPSSILQRNYNGDGGWTQLQGVPGSGGAAWAAAGIDGSIWCCNGDGKMFRWNAATGGWGDVPGWDCAQIDAWTYDNAVHVNNKGELFEYKNGAWDKLEGNGSHITIGAYGEKWHVNTKQEVWHMSPGQDKWKKEKGALKYIHCTDGNNVAGISGEDGANMYRWNSSKLDWDKLPGNGTYIGITWGNMWQVNAKNDIYQAFISG